MNTTINKTKRKGTFLLGHIRSIESRTKQSNSLKSLWEKGVFDNRNLIPWNKNNSGYSVVHKDKKLWSNNISVAIKKTWSKDDKRRVQLSYRMKHDNPSKRPEVKSKISDSVKKLHSNPVYRKKFLDGRKKWHEKILELKWGYSKLEEKVFQTISEIDNSFIHNGKERVILIKRKCPDFISFKTQKIIELFGKYWHKDKNEIIETTKIYNQYGFDVLVITEKDVCDVSKIKEFIR
jgi:hypothetical protein